MDQFLAKLHKKPDHHKKRFALLASGTITLFIFGVWSLATFGVSGVNNVIVADNNTSNVSTVSESEVGPLESFRSSMASSFDALKSSFGQLQDGFNAIDFETEYQEMKDGALKIYGQ